VEVAVVFDATGPVVAGVDGSANGIGALRWAAEEATWRHLALRVVHAVSSPDPRSAEQARHLVDDAVACARAWQPRVEVTGFVYHGTPTAALCAESAHAELVVVGSRGLGGVTGSA
jgi:nucleotide-binding universal stress UspA family protein